MGDGRQRIAFFDVDETLITIKSMFRFLEFHLDSPQQYERAAGLLRQLAADGVSREETNRLYYRNFAGQLETEVAVSGRRWFEHALSTGTLFRAELVQVFRKYQEDGAITALVSGSFTACLDPIAEHLGASHVLSTVPEVADGRYTGSVVSTVIGEGKKAAVEALMAEQGAAPENCVAYGDHASDLPMLLAVGHAGVVGNDPVLLEQARRHGWARLPGPASHEPISQGSM